MRMFESTVSLDAAQLCRSEEIVYANTVSNSFGLRLDSFELPVGKGSFFFSFYFFFFFFFFFFF